MRLMRSIGWRTRIILKPSWKRLSGRKINGLAADDVPEHMKEKRSKSRHVKKYSYNRIAGNYLRLFSMPARILIFITIIVILLIISIIFLQAVL